MFEQTCSWSRNICPTSCVVSGRTCCTALPMPPQKTFLKVCLCVCFCTFQFTYNLRCLTTTHLCIFQMSHVFCTKEMFFFPGQKNFRCVFKCFKGNVHEKKSRFFYLLTLMYFQTHVWLISFRRSVGHKRRFFFCPYHGLIGSHTVLDPSDFHYIHNFLIVFISQVWNHMRLSIWWNFWVKYPFKPSAHFACFFVY